MTRIKFLYFRGLFVGERKTSLPMEFVMRKLIESYPGSIDNKTMDEDLRLLAKESDGWFRIQVFQRYIIVQ